MSKSGNGVEIPEDGQTALELDQESAAPAAEHEPAELVTTAVQETAEPAEQETAEVPANPVMELGNDQDNCWKVLADGERVEFSDTEWRKELTRLLAPPNPQAS